MLCKITNNITKVTQLCSNMDVIKACKKSSDFIVKEVTESKTKKVSNEKSD